MHRIISYLTLIACSSFLTPVLHAQYVITRVDINPGPGNSQPAEMAKIDSILYFQAYDGTNGIEPWISDGTIAGTRMLKDINTGGGSSSPSGFIKYNGKVYFAAADGNGMELWVTDGTANGTVMVKDINPGAGSSNPEKFGVCNGKIFFRANDGTTGRELWISDGTANGTSLIKDIRTGGSGHSDPILFFEYANKTFFQATDGSSGVELWMSDGTANGTMMLRDIYPGIMPSGAGGFTILNNTLYFVANSGPPNNTAFWKTDGTTNGTQMVVDITPPSTMAIGGPFGDIVLFKNKLVFCADSQASSVPDAELWTSDCTQNGTYKLKEIVPGRNSGGRPQRFTIVDSLLFFDADDSVHGHELWITDGTTAGTKMVKDIRVQPTKSSLFSGFANYAHKAFFGALDTFNLQFAELWVSDGTDTGTKKIISYEPVSKEGLRSPPISCHKYLFFEAHFDTTGFELWILRDTTYNGDTIPPQSVSHIAPNDFTIAPNPTHDKVHITLDKSYNDAVISITDMSGRIITKTPLNKNSKSIEMNLQGAAPGIYLVNLKHDTGTITKKLLVQ